MVQQQNNIVTYYYNGFEYVRNGTTYKIVGLDLKFTTLNSLKRHIDFLKLDRHSNISPFLSR